MWMTGTFVKYLLFGTRHSCFMINEDEFCRDSRW